MKTLRDAGLLMVGMLLLTSVKIAPVEGTSSVVPLTHAGAPTTTASPQLPVSKDPSVRVERFEVEVEREQDCGASVIVIGPDDDSGERRVIRLALPQFVPTEAPAPRPVPEAARQVAHALTACNQG
jgi:hypothetical protein